MFFAVDDDMWDGEKRAQYGGAFLFPLDKEAAEGVGVDREMFGHGLGGLMEEIFVIGRAIDINDWALLDEMIESIFEDIIALVHDVF